MAITTWAVADAPAFTSSVLSSTFLQDVNTKLVNIGLIRSSATGQLDETNPGTLTSPVNTGGGGISGAVYYDPMIYTFPTGSGAEPTVSGGAITAEPYDSTPCVLKLFFGWYRCESNTASTAFATICKIQVGLSIDGTGAWTSTYFTYNSAYPLMSSGVSGGSVTQTFRSTNSYLQNTGKNFFFMLCPDMVQHGSDVTYSSGMASSSLVFISMHRDNGKLYFISPTSDDSTNTTTTPAPKDMYGIVISSNKKAPLAVGANTGDYVGYTSASLWPRFGGTTAAATISSAIIYQPCWYLDVNGVVSSFNCNSTYMNSAVTKATITGANVTYPSGTVQRNYLHLGLLNTVYYTANASSYALAILYE